jgi:hypothetical protein
LHSQGFNFGLSHQPVPGWVTVPVLWYRVIRYGK